MKKKPISNNLKYYRKKAGYTQAQLAGILAPLKNGDYSKLPNNLRFYREKMGLSLEQVANKLGIKSPKTIEKWENAESMPDVRQVGLMVGMYKATLEQLYEKMGKEIDKDIAKRKKELGIYE